jgi:uncharacterized protein
MYLRRTLEDHVLRLSRSYPVLAVTGPRQVGKTTLLEHLAVGTERRRVSLDEAVPRALANEDPDLFLERYPPPVLIDEVQNAPPLFPALKPVADRSPTGSYWLTGSQHFPLMRSVAESLAGRVGLVELSGLSQAEEFGSGSDLPFRPDRVSASPAEWGSSLDVFRRLVRGTFPRLAHADAPPWESFYGSYVQTYLERDLRSLASVNDLSAFRRFLQLCAARIGQLVNLSELARDARISVSTAGNWIALLEASYQVILLRPYFENQSKRTIKTPKLYFRDPGLACYLLGWLSAETAMAGAMAGALLENYAVSEILKSYLHRGREAPVWFYRTKEKVEVDLLLAEEGRLFPVEIKLTARPDRGDLKGIEALRRTGAPVGPGAVLCFVREAVALSREVEALPVAAIG